MKIRDIISIVDQYSNFDCNSINESKHTVQLKYGELDVFDINSIRDINGLIAKYAEVRAILLQNGFMGWESSEATHGDLEDYVGEGINLRISREGNEYEITTSRNNDLKSIRSNPYFNRVFGKVSVHFIDDEEYSLIIE